MAELTCASCGFLLDGEHSYCPSCGARSERSRSAESVDSDEERSRARLQGAVGDDYRIGRLIGKGGFAQVFEASDVRLGRSVAIKVVRPDLVVSEELVERFQREARAMAALRHPNVMEVYTVGEAEGVAYFVMPYIQGESLGSLLRREGALPLDEAGRVLIEAAAAMEAAHRSGTVHRDIKPDNILLEGEARRVVIADFGIARALEASTSTLTGTGMFVGTPKYMSPEQAVGDDLDHRSDIYSLGVVAFEMIAGRLPFEARSTQALIAQHLTEDPPPLWTLRTDCPERLAAVVQRCLAKDPGDRWESFADLVAALEGADDSFGAVVGNRGGPMSAGQTSHDSGGAPASAAVHGTGAVGDGAPESVRALRRTALLVGVAWVVLLVADAAIGLGGVSAWLAVVLGFYLAARAARLWRDGHEWRDILLPPSAAGADSVVTGEHGSFQDEGFGRFGTLVRACTADRAVILKAFAGLSRQEQARFPQLQPTTEALMHRVKHLARGVVTLEDRLADTAKRLDRGRGAGPGADPLLAMSTLSRHGARLQELNSARDGSAAELRACVSRLEDVCEAITERLSLDPSRGMDELARVLGEAGQYLGERAG